MIKKATLIISFLCISFFYLRAQPGFGFELGYVLAPKKEAFSGRLFFGDYISDTYRINVGGEYGDFQSNPTQRILPYFSVKAGIDYNFLADNDTLHPYIGVDFEFLKTIKIVNEHRVSIFPRAGVRLFNVLFIEVAADNLNEPGDEARFFDVKMNSYRVNLGFNYYMEW